MTSQSEIHSVIDSVVNEILAETQIESPPVNAFQIAHKLGWEIVLNSGQSERGRRKRIQGQTTIFLKPDERPERVQWALAHELGESLSDRWANWIDSPGFSAPSASREAIANLFANRLLLPECWFRSEVAQTGNDLFAMKSIFPTASYQLIGNRLLDLEEPLIVTVFDQGQMTSRLSNWPGSVPPLQPAEQRCWQNSHSHGERCQHRADQLETSCWPVHEPQWKREILLTSPLEFE
ncbi:MAG: ImmA/IrrE family metallo-endopeptidase [Planctomycetaceae bacterium]|nr:ImmA/IrrE family metallo-endopeptidase [Planctomycetaceae bacterium]